MPARMKLSSVYTTLPPAERKVADFILANPDDAAHMVINEIAHHAGVSVPSVTRLARKLGYSGFMDFRVSLASGSSAVKKEGGAPISPDDTDSELIRKLMIGHMNAIESTLKVLDAEKLAELANTMLEKKRIVWFGAGACLGLCNAVSDALCKMGLDSVVILNRDIMETYAASLDTEVVAVFVSKTGRTVKTLAALRTAKQAGAVTAFITNLANSSGEAYADYFFCTSRQDDLFRTCGYETGTSTNALLESLMIVIGRRKRLDSEMSFSGSMDNDSK